VRPHSTCFMSVYSVNTEHVIGLLNNILESVQESDVIDPKNDDHYFICNLNFQR
jgi:hypothetical protein